VRAGGTREDGAFAGTLVSGCPAQSTATASSCSGPRHRCKASELPEWEGRIRDQYEYFWTFFHWLLEDPGGLASIRAPPFKSCFRKELSSQWFT
jgi:hypothetical protein